MYKLFYERSALGGALSLMFCVHVYFQDIMEANVLDSKCFWDPCIMNYCTLTQILVLPLISYES